MQPCQQQYVDRKYPRFEQIRVGQMTCTEKGSSSTGSTVRACNICTKRKCCSWAARTNYWWRACESNDHDRPPTNTTRKLRRTLLCLSTSSLTSSTDGWCCCCWWRCASHSWVLWMLSLRASDDCGVMEECSAKKGTVMVFAVIKLQSALHSRDSGD